jgi:serine protease Do
MCRVFVIAILLIVHVFSPAVAQNRPFNYSQAERIFNELPLDAKALLQLYLIAQGTSVTVPLDTYGTRLHDSMSRYQASRGLQGGGVLNRETIEALRRETEPLFRTWDLQPLSHPVYGRPIWAPMGLGLRVTRTKEGVTAKTPDESMTLMYDYYQGQHAEIYPDFVRFLQQRGFNVSYKLLRNDFFVVSGSRDNFFVYVRFHAHQNGALGFIFFYPSNVSLRTDRLTNLISSSLHMQMNYGGLPELPFGSPSRGSTDQQARTPPIHEAPPPSRSGQATKPADKGPSSGTGFFVSAAGHILTNQHVVDGCADIVIYPEQGEPVPARIQRADRANDLAILTTSGRPKSFARFRSNEPRLGENIAAFGFPLAPLLSRSGNFTLGNVTSLAGLGDDSRFVQISAPVQSGNSGGPLLDHSGHVTGVVTSKLNAIKTAVVTGDLPQNVNFAIKSQMAVSFLAANQIAVEYGASGAPTLSAPDLAQRAKAISVFVECKSISR